MQRNTPMAVMLEESVGSLGLTDVAQTCIALQARIINRAITSIYQEALRPFSVTVAQMNLLVAIGVLGPVRASDMVDPLQVEKSTLSRNLDRMRHRGWVEVMPDEGDGRASRLRLTDKGREQISVLMPAWQEAQRKTSCLLGDDLVQGLEQMTRKVRE